MIENENQANFGTERVLGQEVVAEGELSSEVILERALLYAFEQGVEMLEQSGGFEPFITLIKGEELFIEELSVEDEAEGYAAARRTVFQMEKLCNAYVFCYDGYVTLDDGTSDAIVVEYANRDDETAQLIVQLYHHHGEHMHFEETLYQVGEAESFFNEEAPESAGETTYGQASESQTNEPTAEGELDSALTDAVSGLEA